MKLSFGNQRKPAFKGAQSRVFVILCRYVELYFTNFKAMLKAIFFPHFKCIFLSLSKICSNFAFKISPTRTVIKKSFMTGSLENRHTFPKLMCLGCVQSLSAIHLELWKEKKTASPVLIPPPAPGWLYWPFPEMRSVSCSHPIFWPGSVV